jgi:hypothetical protein
MLTAAYQLHKFIFPMNLAPPATEKLTTTAPQGPSAGQKDKLFSPKIFRINFHYRHQVVHLKVLKLVYRGGETIYKVALNSALSHWNNTCWLQRRLQVWVIVLGSELDEKLKLAITSAIERQELTII